MKISRKIKSFALVGTILASSTLGLIGCANGAEKKAEEKVAVKENLAETIKTSEDAIAHLKKGNDVFMKGTDSNDVSIPTREALVKGQAPHTCVITCSDSRVPPELIFNAGLGELFTIRTAGNVVAPFETGSVEYAVEHLGSKVVLVMGHSTCGAVKAAVGGHAEGDIQKIVDEIIPSVVKAKKEVATDADEKTLASKAEDINVMNSIAVLRQSKIIKHLEEEGKIKLVGAKYNLETGKVDFFDYSAN